MGLVHLETPHVLNFAKRVGVPSVVDVLLVRGFSAELDFPRSSVSFGRS